MKSLATLLILLFLAAAIWALSPFTTHNVVFSPGLDKNRPAGQITREFSLQELVPASFLPTASGQPADCIALRFATYMRRNSGALGVSFGQGEYGHRWTLDASKLNDNAYVNLCLDRPIQPGEPFWIGIEGIDGTNGSAATVWLSSSRDRVVTVNGKPEPGWGLALRLTRTREIGATELAGLNGGIFAIGFLISLIIGVATLLFSCSRSAVAPTIAGRR